MEMSGNVAGTANFANALSTARNLVLQEVTVQQVLQVLMAPRYRIVCTKYNRCTWYLRYKQRCCQITVDSKGRILCK